MGGLRNRSAGLGERTGTWGAERPSTRSPCASPPACKFNGALTAWRPETGGANRSGSERASAPVAFYLGLGMSWRYGWLPVTFLPGMVVYADSTAGTTGPQLLYADVGAANLRAYVQGSDDIGARGAEQLSAP